MIQRFEKLYISNMILGIKELSPDQHDHPKRKTKYKNYTTLSTETDQQII